MRRACVASTQKKMTAACNTPSRSVEQPINHLGDILLGFDAVDDRACDGQDEGDVETRDERTGAGLLKSTKSTVGVIQE